MQTIGRTIVTLALAAASAAAHAFGGPIDLSSGSAAFSDTPPAGFFSIDFTFTLAEPMYLNASVGSVVSGDQDIDFITVTVISPTSTQYGFSRVLEDPFETWTLTMLAQPPGAYRLRLEGINSAGIASFAGTIAVSAIPVPEPATYASLLAGFATLGLRRRWAR